MVDLRSALQLRFQVASYLFILIIKLAQLPFCIPLRLQALTETEKYLGFEQYVLFLLVL